MTYISRGREQILERWWFGACIFEFGKGDRRGSSLRGADAAEAWNKSAKARYGYIYLYGMPHGKEDSVDGVFTVGFLFAGGLDGWGGFGGT